MNQESTPATGRSFGRRCGRAIYRVVRFIFIVAAVYILIIIVGLIPVNNAFQPTPGGVEILLVSSAVHADVVLPIRTETVDWREPFPSKCFSGNTNDATHVAIGWGDKGFFINTPTWADLSASTAANALLWPSETCMHVSFTKAEYLQESRSVRISHEQYEQMVEFINSSFRQEPTGSMLQIEGARYGANDAFFEAQGTYHCLNTCNCWVGRALKSAGIRTGWLTPMPKSVFLYLPNDP